MNNTDTNQTMTNTTHITPELGQKVPANTQIEFRVGYSGKYYLTTALELKGRGISLSADGANHKRGLCSYFATDKAMAKLEAEYICTYISHLD
jgi:hypothetical protein